MRVGVEIELTEREEFFIRAMVIHGLRPTRAAKVSGYAVSTARHLLRKPHIRAAIKNVSANVGVLMSRFEKDAA